jgi:putative sigma-54 modulation protein
MPMQIEFTGRNFDITEELRERISERLHHAARELADVAGAHVILSVEKYRHEAEVVVRRKRGRLTGQASARDMQQAIHKAVERIESQLGRKRDKMLARKRRGTAAKAEVVPLPVAPASARAAREGRLPRVVEERPDRVKPMALDEAILLLEDARRPFVAYRSAGSDRLAIVYRRADGNFGTIELKD